MILCVGPVGVGKTLLLKRLQRKEFLSLNYSDIPNTVTTVGTNMITMTVQNRKIKIKEIGGSMNEIWSQHFDDCKGIIYVIDASDLMKIGDSCTFLVDLVQHPTVKGIKPVLVVLNKTDVHCDCDIEEIKYFLMLEETNKLSPNKIQIVEASCVTAKGLESIFNWVCLISE